MRQLPLTLTAQVPFREPFRGCRSRPGKAMSRGSTATLKRPRIRRSRAACFDCIPAVVPRKKKRSRPFGPGSCRCSRCLRCGRASSADSQSWGPWRQRQQDSEQRQPRERRFDFFPQLRPRPASVRESAGLSGSRLLTPKPHLTDFSG